MRQADDQTVLGLAALQRAIRSAGWGERSFADWGLLGAPRFLGRARVAAALERFRGSGPRGMSALLLPHLSLHSPAGALTLALDLHGPNFGVGGGIGSLSEALLGSLALLDEGLPGLWLVLTAWDPEPLPDDNGQCAEPTVGHGLGLALMPPAPLSPGLSLRFQPEGALAPDAPEGCVPALAAFLEEPAGEWLCPLAGGGVLAVGLGRAQELPTRRAG